MTTDATYDAAWFHDVMTTLEQYLFELAWIDSLLAAWAPRRGHEGAAPAGHYEMVFSVGETHEFDIELHVPVDDVPQMRADYERMHAAAVRFAEDEAIALRHAIAPVLDAEPGVLTPLINQVMMLQLQLDPPTTPRGAVDVPGLMNSIENWEGRAADDFREFFYDTFQACRTAQSHAVASVGVSLASVQYVGDAAQHSAMNAAVAASLALEEQLRDRQATRADTGMRSEEAFWAATSEVTALLSLTAFLPPLAPVGAAAGVVSTVSGVAAAGLARDGRTSARDTDVLTVAGTSAETISEDLRSAFSTIVSAADENYARLGRAVEAKIDELEDREAARALVPAAPREVGLGPGTEPRDFQHGPSWRVDG